MATQFDGAQCACQTGETNHGGHQHIAGARHILHKSKRSVRAAAHVAKRCKRRGGRCIRERQLSHAKRACLFGKQRGIRARGQTNHLERGLAHRAQMLQHLHGADADGPGAAEQDQAPR